MIVGGVAPDDTSEPGIAGVGYLELPAQNSFQSGIGVISGWVCTATNVVIEINGTSNSPTYGGERTDTQDSCDDTDNGFAMAFNWSLLGDGQHTVVAKADGVEIGRATVTVTTLGEEFVRGAEGEALVQDFPLPGQSVTVEWQQAHQNFTITGVSGTGTCLRTSAAVAGRGFGLAKDCATLLGLKDTLRGSASLNWAETLNMDSWDGLTVRSARVTGLSLEGNQLTGIIPSELGGLSNLEELSLHDNQLSGAIPSELGDLTNLTVLSLHDNQLSGAIPSELGDLTNLTYLDLDANQLSGAIPSELGGLTNLTVLALPDNQLSGAIPSELGDLTNLTGLLLHDNQLTGDIPSELGGLTNLRSLSLSANQLTGDIPSELGDLTNLQGSPSPTTN